MYQKNNCFLLFFGFFSSLGAFQPDFVHPAIVIGGGPAGLCAAEHIARYDYKTLVLAENLGNLAQAHQVENWPGREQTSGITLINDLRDHVIASGAELLDQEVIQIDCSQQPFIVKTSDGNIHKGWSLVLAMGATPEIPQIPHINEFIGSGIALCLICDAPFDKGKTVGIIGHDDIAFDKALRLAHFAKKVYILCQKTTPTAHIKAFNAVKATANIELLTNIEITDLLGNEHLETLAFYDKTSQKDELLPLQSIYLSVGFKPNTDLVKDQLICDKNGYIKIFNNTQSTSCVGIFAAGLVEDTIYQKAANIAGRGVQAGLDVIAYLQSINIKAVALNTPEKYTQKSLKHPLIPIIKTEQQFRESLNNHGDELVIIDFYIPGCPACIQITPLLEQCAQSNNTVHIYKIEYDSCPALTDYYDIQQVPAFLFFKKGQLLENVQKSITRSEFLELIKKYNNP